MPSLILKKSGQEVSRYTLVTTREEINGKALVLTKGDKKLYGQLGLTKPSDVKGIKFYKDGQVWYLQKKIFEEITLELPTVDNVPKVYAIGNGSYEIVDVANVDDTVKNNIKTNVKILVTENKIEITKQTARVGSVLSGRFDSRYSGSTLSTFFQNIQPITSITIRKTED